MNYIYQNTEYKTQEEINKMSYNEKFISCKCGKKPEFRWVKSGLTVLEGKGLFYSISPFKGRNGEEVCHKCAPCAKCGKEVDYSERFYKSEETNDNPSGKWSLAHCSIECFNGTEKPSLPKKAPEKFHLNANCDHCGKWSEIKVGNAHWGKSFCSTHCYELAYARVGSLKTRDEIRAHCCTCGFRILDSDNNFAENFKNRKDKSSCWSDRSINALYCSETCFEKRGEKVGANCRYENGSIKYNYGSTQSDNSPKPNPTSPNFQPITNSTDKSDNSVQPSRGSTDSPPTSNPQLEKPDHSFEIKLNPPADNPKNSPPANQSGAKQENENKQVLVINLKDIKSISLVGNNLVIEFNQSQQSQTVVSEQVSNNQDLAKVKKYLQSTHRSRVSNQELASILGGQKGANNPGANSPSQPSQIPLIAAVSVVGIALIGGLSLLVVKLKKTSCSHKVKKVK